MLASIAWPSRQTGVWTADLYTMFGLWGQETPFSIMRVSRPPMQWSILPKLPPSRSVDAVLLMLFLPEPRKGWVLTIPGNFSCNTNIQQITSRATGCFVLPTVSVFTPTTSRHDNFSKFFRSFWMLDEIEITRNNVTKTIAWILSYRTRTVMSLPYDF